MKRIIEGYNVLFWDFVHKYDISNTNIIRKIIHSFKVADVCFDIASIKGLDENERNFAYLMGLFHDLGRFEQWKIYQSFDDAKTVDHADISALIIDSYSCEDLVIDEWKKELLKTCVKYHTKIYDGDDEQVKLYNSILNNADAFSNVTTCVNGAMRVLQTEDGVSEDILGAFKERKLMRIYSPKTKLDRCLILTACFYYVKFDFLVKELLNKRYLDILYETLSKYLNDADKALYWQILGDLKEEMNK